MLSAYETGKQKPSLDTLEKILDGLDASLDDLHRALLIVHGKDDPLRPSLKPVSSTYFADADVESDLHRILGVRGSIPPEEEQAFRQMLAGFHRLLRFMHRHLSEVPETSGEGSEEGGDEEP